MKVLEQLFAWDNVLWFVLGGIVGLAIERLRMRREDVTDPKNAPHKHTIHWRKIGAAFFIFLGIVIFVQSYQGQRATERNSEQQLALAQEVRGCNLQFTDALAYRSNIAVEDAVINDQERERQKLDQEAIQELIQAILAGPGQQDTLIAAAGKFNDRLVESDRKFDELEEMRKVNNEKRAANPYPAPSCGIPK